LTDAFTEIGDAFTVAKPDATVSFNFAASSQLVTQITEGAPADVFASADQSNMTKLIDAGASAGEPVGSSSRPATRSRSAASRIWRTTI
jgi:molybdate transport system substrate-binding protein